MATLNRHIERMHGINKDKGTCEICGEEFSSLKRHMITHTNISKDITCNDCEFKTHSHSILNAHM